MHRLQRPLPPSLPTGLLIISDRQRLEAIVKDSDAGG
jgi:hypothetical protein